MRRLILAEPAGAEGWVCRLLAEVLNGRLLRPDSPTAQPVARLVRTRGDPFLRKYYARSARIWATVSPVLLPGFDGRTDRRSTRSKRLAGSKQMDRVEGLVRKSLAHAGVTVRPDIELSPVSWWAGVPAAIHFVPRDKLGPCPRYHVKLTFKQDFAGPLSLGRQRHAGLGVFAAIEGGKD